MKSTVKNTKRTTRTISSNPSIDDAGRETGPHLAHRTDMTQNDIPEGFTCLNQLLRQTIDAAVEADWGGDQLRAIELFNSAKRIKARIDNGELVEPNF